MLNTFKRTINYLNMQLFTICHIIIIIIVVVIISII